jgi:hypothetical protein
MSARQLLEDSPTPPTTKFARASKATSAVVPGARAGDSGLRGQRLLDTTAKMLVKRFFKKLTSEVAESAASSG